jgi:aromatic ring-opening dioxygenase LigB subunit
MSLEHGIMVPLSFIDPNHTLPIVPILQNCMAPPMPSLRRCWEFGKLIRDVAEKSGRRVAVVGTGGLSHSPGAPEAGFIDEAFDRRFLELLASDSPEDALDLPNEAIDSAGFGTWEIRQWATALGAAGGRGARVLAYEAIKEWETGCSAVVFDAASTSMSSALGRASGEKGVAK